MPTLECAASKLHLGARFSLSAALESIAAESSIQTQGFLVGPALEPVARKLHLELGSRLAFWKTALGATSAGAALSPMRNNCF